MRQAKSWCVVSIEMACGNAYFGCIDHWSKSLPFQKTFALSCLLSPFMVGAGNADDTYPIFARNDVNAFYVAYEVIEGHPECSQPDQIAFNTNIHATGLSYRMHDVQEGRYVDVMTDGTFDGQQCFRTIRRGVETVSFEADCEPEQTARGAPLASLGVELDFSAEIASCLSPSSYELLEGTWSFVAHNSQNEVVSSGSFGSEGNTEPNQTRDSEPVAVHVSYELFGSQMFGWPDLLQDVRGTAVFDGATIIQAQFDCIPFRQDGYPLSSLFIETEIGLLLAKQTLQACSSRGCFDRNIYMSTSTHARRCLAEEN